MIKKLLFSTLFAGTMLLGGAEIEAQGRRVFYRGEANAFITVKISGNDSGKLLVRQPGCAEKKIPVSSGKVKIPVNTMLIPGKYQLFWQLGKDSGSIDFTVGPQYFTGFPIGIWGDGFVSHKIYQQRGFTHALRYRSTRYLLRTEKKFYEMDSRELDESLADGFIHGDTFDIGCARWGYAAELKQKYPRISRYGSFLTGNINIQHPEARNAMENAAIYLARKLASHPAYGMININSEVRDSTMPSFSKYDKEAYRKYSGGEIPELVNNKYAPYYTEIPGFPVSRIVPDDHPLLKYYVWFWKEGDGWNRMNSIISRIYHKRAKHPFITMFDPAVRCPPVWGNGGSVDVLNHWTYVDPDPVRVLSTIDEMRSMAAENGKQIYGMGQLFVYRENVAPAAAEKEYPAERFAAIKNERYITTPPDMLQEMIWAMMFRKISGMMFHGCNAYFPLNQKGKYANSLSGTDEKLGEILLNTVKPLSPLVSSLPDRPAQIAVFQGIAASIFAGRGSQGNESWPYVVYRMLQYGGYDPEMLFEEQLLRDGFGELKIIVLPHCDVLTASALKKLKEFQKQGGIIIGDEFLVPALMPDWRLSCRELTGGINDAALVAAEKTLSAGKVSRENSRKLNLQRAGRTLAGILNKYVVPYASSDNADIITSYRKGGKADYLFAVNDRRTFGDYLGIYGRVMEKGMPNSGKVRLDRSAQVVYNVLSGEKVNFRIESGKTVVPVEFSTNDGRVFLLLDEELEKAVITVPAGVKVGSMLDFEVKIYGSSGKVLPAMIPLRMQITYADGRIADLPQYQVTAADGIYKGKFMLPLNLPGEVLTFAVETLPGRISASSAVKINR